MALIDVIPDGATPDRRAAALPAGTADAQPAYIANTLTGSLLALYQRLSALQCWDASLLCAWAAKGVECGAVSLTSINFGVVSADAYDRIFGPNVLANPRRVVGTARQ